MSDEKERKVKRDPYDMLQPVFRGEHPEEGNVWVLEDGITVAPVESERNLWELYVDGVIIVTFDASTFPTTANLGKYIEKAVSNMTSDEREDGEEDEGEDEFSVPDAGASRSYQ
jgi:hypothetical protein